MNLYNRKIQYYKSFKLIDTNGDGVKDTIVYSPISTNYHLQFSLEQDIKNVGYFDNTDDTIPEVLDLGNFWNNQSHEEADYNHSRFSSFVEPDSSVKFCNDPKANNYNPSLIGVNGYSPCENNECCGYDTIQEYKRSKKTVEQNLNCLVFYTDWGPWNDELIYNDTEQIYVKKIDCTFSLRLINQLYIENEFVKGGWYGASILIEVDNGYGFSPIEPSNSIISNIDSDIIFNEQNKTFTLSDKVRIWKINSNTNPNKYYTTKPYRDITFKSDSNSKIRVTYLNSNVDITHYQKYAKHLRLQLIKGYIPVTTPTPPTPTKILSGYTWAQNIVQLNEFIGKPIDRYSEGETFHYIQNGDVENKYLTWQNYLNGYKEPKNKVYWGPSSTEIEVGSFYTNPNVKILNDFGDDNQKTILYNIDGDDLNYYTNPNEMLIEYPFNCNVKENYVSFFDRNGDGFVENGNLGSVDNGLFSKTRYDSPYIFIKPGTKDGLEPLNDNPLTITSKLEKDFPYSPSSNGGWKNYAYVTTQLIKSLTNVTNYSFKNVSPTCQLGGVNHLSIVDTKPEMVDQSNSNIFLQQPYFNNYSKYADFGTGTTIPHIWNINSNKGGCCSKTYDSSLDISSDGPYYNSECLTCHGQMTARSAQPVLDETTRIAMQTTDSDTYYGPFYDPQNPTYNGYGLAFSKANKFCRDVKNKNGVEIINSELGVSTDELYIGGILHGGGVQYTPNKSLTDSYGVIVSTQTGFDEITPLNFTDTCVVGTKLPLKCTRVNNDPNCPKNNCMKCIFGFKCSSEEKQSGVFTGNNSDLKGPTNGIKYIKW